MDAKIAIVCKTQAEYRDWMRDNIPNRSLHHIFIPVSNSFDVVGRQFAGVFFVREEYNPYRKYRFIQTKGQDTNINVQTDLRKILEYVESLK